LELIHPKIPIKKKPKTYVVPPLKEGETNKGWSMTTVIRKKGGKAENVIYYHTNEWDTKYSKSDAGSSVSGGWTKEGKLLFVSWVKMVRAAPRNRRGTHAMEELIWRAPRTEYSIEADNPEVEDLDTRRLVAQDSKEDIDWDAAIGFNLFGGNEANDLANPAGNEVEKSDNPSPDEHQEEEDSDQHSGSSEAENKHTFQSEEDKDE
jgi:predicted transposase YbfD/YdcC